MNTQSCKVAIVGAGLMAREHIRAFADVPDVTVAGIFSRTRSRAEALASEFGIPAVYDTLPALYEGTKADLVLVTVFETAMKAVALGCLEYPWAVFLEKPPGMNLDEALEINSAARAKNRTVVVGLNRRFLSSTQAVVTDLTQHTGPRFIHVQDQQNLKAAAALGQPEAVVQNWMYANSIHLVDYLPLLGRGRVVNVSVPYPWNPETSQVVLATIEFESGDKGVYEGIWDGPGPWAVSVTTPEIRWEMRPLEQVTYQNQGERQRHEVARHERDTQFKPGLRLQAEHVVARCQGKPSCAPLLSEALATMQLIHDIFGQ